ncbi:hypothetical protein PI125_g17753 [Phytophthora idaei]|nr:hypothetical protein PI125_g17753 [Phytophthora idaei]
MAKIAHSRENICAAPPPVTSAFPPQERISSYNSLPQPESPIDCSTPDRSPAPHSMLCAVQSSIQEEAVDSDADAARRSEAAVVV